jgi:hypothetical protein
MENKYYAVRSCSYPGGPSNPTDIPDGMFVRESKTTPEQWYMTDSPSAAKLFTNRQDAISFITSRNPKHDSPNGKLFVVDVEVKVVAKSIAKIGLRVW